MFTNGTVGTILQLLKLPDGTVKVLVEGGHRARVTRFTENAEFFQAFAEPVEEYIGDRSELAPLFGHVCLPTMSVMAGNIAHLGLVPKNAAKMCLRKARGAG